MQTISAPSSRYASLIGYSGFVLLGWNIVLVPSLIRLVERDFHQTDAAFGLFYFISSLAYGTGAFSGGMLIERFGRRVLLSAAALALGAGLIGEAISPVWAGLFVALLPAGWGGGVLDSGTNGLFLDLYRSARGGALNRLHLFFGIGAFIGPFLTGLLVTAGLAWRPIIFVVGVGFFCLAIPFALVSMPSGRRTEQDRHETVTISRAEQSLLPFVGLALSIGLYVAAEVAVSNWLVKYLIHVPVETATAVLSGFWGGLSLGRLLSNWLAERIDYYVFTIGCMLLASAALVAAVLTPSVPVAALFFGLTGMFYGPVYPMIMVLGGNVYPRRLAALSGSLAAAAVAGSVIYPPLMGLLAARIGLAAGLIGAALLGVPTALSMVAVRRVTRRLAAQDEAVAPSGTSRRRA